MNSEGHRAISNSLSSEDTEPSELDKRQETTNGENLDRTTEAQLHSSHFPQVDVTRREKSALCATKYAPHKTAMTRSATPNHKKPRDFLTGIEYRTKFMREITNGKNLYRTTKARIHISRLSQLDVTRREKSPSSTMEYESRRTKARSLTPGDEKPRDFITGVDYRTKFMRETPYDAGEKYRFNSEARNSPQTKVDARTASNWRPNRENLIKQPTRKEDVKKSTSEVGRNHRQPLPKRKPPQFNKSMAEVRRRKFDARAREMLLSQKRSKAATPSSYATKTESSLIQRKETRTRLKLKETSRFTFDFEQTNDSIDQNMSEKFLYGINKADLSINLPNSPSSEPRGSNSLHTTPRSPRLAQKNPSNSFMYSAISGTLSPMQGHSVLHAEMLEIKRTRSPTAAVRCSPKPPSPSKKYKVLPSSDITLTTKPWESVAKEPRSKTSNSKQEPMTFTSRFVPLLSWTDKTNPGGLFEPQAHHGSNSSLNSIVNPDGGNASTDKFQESKLLNQPSKETTSINGNAVQNERCLQQQIAANEDCDLPCPSLTDIPGEGEKITNATIPKKKSMTQDENPPKDTDRSLARNRLPIVKRALKLTGPQQAVSGCALRPATNSQIPKRPQSMKTITMTKQPSAYTRNATQALGDFTRRSTSAGIKGKKREAAVNKKPVWK